MDTNDKSHYWASKPTEEVGHDVVRRIEGYYEYIRKNGRIALWRRAYEAYYSSVRSGGQVYNSGELDEYTNVDVNDFRNLLLHLKSMIMAQRIAFDPQAINTDHDSMSQVILSRSILENELREGDLEDVADTVIENGLVFGEGYVELSWDTNGGATYTTDDEGEPVREGALEMYVYTPTDIIFDYTRTDTKHDWYITRRLKNRYDLMAKYPDLEEEILHANVSTQQKDTIFGVEIMDDSDLIPVFVLHHKPTDALPEGRYLEMVGPDAILNEGPYPHETLQIYPMQPSTQRGTPFGYSVSFDLLPLQEAVNNLYATVATNQANFGVQNILVPEGHNLSVQSITDGLNLLTYNPNVGKPESLNLTNTPREIFDFIQMLSQKMETIAGVTQVARNSANVGQLSGAAMALLQATAIQFNSDLQRSYTKFMERVGTGIIQIYQDYADTERVAAVVGKANKPLMTSWTKEDISGIQRVTVDVGNPLTRTTAGKVSLADSLLQAGMVENADQYLQVIDTGRIEPLIQGKRDELLNIKSENESLSEGKVVKAVVTDNHAMHVIEHKSVIASPQARNTPKILEATLAHIQEHINQLRTGDPAVLQLTGQQPLPPEQPAQAPMAGGSAIPQPGGMTEKPQTAADSGVNMPNEPNMPKNPMTGNSFNMADGGA